MSLAQQTPSSVPVADLTISSGIEENAEGTTEDIPFRRALFAGAFAGVAVDVTLFPLDTLRTRQQSAQGFWKAGGFRGIFNGLSAATVGGAPAAALFFSTYESVKPFVRPYIQSGPGQEAVTDAAAAAFGELAACLIRVPTENVKQNLQVGEFNRLTEAVTTICRQRGMFGLFRGYTATILRDSPFAMIQFPIWETLRSYGKQVRRRDLNDFEVSLCGSVAGATTAVLTCPLDVIKTRMILRTDASGVEYLNFGDCVARMYSERGVRTFFTGVAPRTGMISLGGFVFLGGYNFASNRLKKRLD